MKRIDFFLLAEVLPIGLSSCRMFNWQNAQPLRLRRKRLSQNAAWRFSRYFAKLQLLVFMTPLCLLANARADTPDSHGMGERIIFHGNARCELPSARETVRLSLDSLNAQTEIPVPKQRLRTVEAGSPFLISAETANYLLIAALAVLAAIVLITVFDNLRPQVKSGGVPRAPVPEELRAAERRMGVAMNEADVFAAGGDYAEAMHILLLQSLDEMRRRLGIPLAISLTSREILVHAGLRPEAKDALSDIVSRVEISYFGEHAPDAEEYRLCRQSYSTLTGLLGAGCKHG